MVCLLKRKKGKNVKWGEKMSFLSTNKKLIKCEVCLIFILIILTVLSFLLGKNMLNLSNVILRFISKCFIITLSLCINTSIVICINTIRNDVKQDVLEKYNIKKCNLILLVFLIFVFFIFTYSLYTRKTFYFWDYANYYKIQNNTSRYINNCTDIFSIVKYIIYSIHNDNYNNFLCVILECLVEILPNTGVESYIFIYMLIGILPVIYVIYLFVLKLFSLLNVKRPYISLILCLAGVCSCPLFYNSAIRGQPDVIGIIFIFIIFGLLIDYSFEKIDIGKLACLFISTLYLIIVRRWYMFLVIGFYASYFIMLMIKVILLKDKGLRKNIIKNVFIFGLISLVLICIMLLPLLVKIMKYSYATNYAFYNKGGLVYEIKHQKTFLGWFYTWLVILGIVIGLVNRKTRNITAMMFMSLCFTTILFTRIQNMATHHSYLLLVEYFVIIFVLIINIMEFSFTTQRLRLFNKFDIIYCSKYLIFGVLFVLFSSTITLSIQGNCKSKVFSSISLKPVHRTDYWDILKVYNFIQDNVNDGEVAYIIASSGIINAEIFRNAKLPAVTNKITSGCAPSGTGKFDVNFFEAKYIITCDPFEDLVRDEDSITKKLSQILDEMIELNRVELVESFETKTGHNFYIYERVGGFNIEDVYLAQEYLADEMKNYPSSYAEVFDNYIQKKSKK